MRKHSMAILAMMLVLLAALPAAAGTMHVGAGIGNTFFSSDYKDALDQVKEIDENSTAWKIFGGFSSDSFFGLEGGYRDFGKVETTVDGGSFSSKTTGWDIEALGRLQIAIVDIFGKAGMMFWSTDTTLLGAPAEDSGTGFFWGLGAGVHLGAIGVRLEWESLEGGDMDSLSMVSLGATLGF